MFFLRLDLRGGKARVPIDRTLVFGRSNTADIILDAPIISRLHSRICLRDGGLFLEDLGSATGTQRNGVPVKAPELLVVGDIIDIGTFSFAIEDAQHHAAPPRPPALSPVRTSDDVVLPSDRATEAHSPVPDPAAQVTPGGGLASLQTADEILPPDLEATTLRTAPQPQARGLSPSATTVDTHGPTWSSSVHEAPGREEAAFDEETIPHLKNDRSS